jgi:nitrogen fixation/metabolism regulation signal transduction histidine kinase
MAFRRFELRVTLQVASILALCAGIAYLTAVLGYYASAAIMMVLLAAQVAGLLRYIEETNRELSRFLAAIRHQDLSQKFSAERRSGLLGELSAAFEDILQRLRDSRTMKEEQAHYLNTLVQHVPVAVLVVDDTGRIDLINSAARRLLGKSPSGNVRDYASLSAELPERLLRLQSAERQLIKITRESTALQLNVLATQMRIGGRDLKIISLQDIQGELESREIEAWQNLIRVLTHEIMNSVTPIASLAATASELLVDAREPDKTQAAIHDVEDAIDTIAKRSAGLMHFVESYRRLTRIPKPVSHSQPVSDVFRRVGQLMEPELERRGIELTQHIEPPTLKVHADTDLLEQALINLIRNSMDALADVAQPQVRLRAELDTGGRTLLTVEDNGAGMNDEVRDNIFVPFFTTKRSGSGVGLSLVRQIMRAHGGNVGVRTAVGSGTSIRLSF